MPFPPRTRSLLTLCDTALRALGAPPPRRPRRLCCCCSPARRSRRRLGLHAPPLRRHLHLWRRALRAAARRRLAALLGALLARRLEPDREGRGCLEQAAALLGVVNQPLPDGRLAQRGGVAEDEERVLRARHRDVDPPLVLDEPHAEAALPPEVRPHRREEDHRLLAPLEAVDGVHLERRRRLGAERLGEDSPDVPHLRVVRRDDAD
mmetsp:Transcript_26379/g.87891  ORF Transcript_26379/g.87891 Transcript_26379/m.87891 type:complete len:207 (-) Transcript_26379:931-1551(-)